MLNRPPEAGPSTAHHTPATARSLAMHPSGTVGGERDAKTAPLVDEDGSLITEYGLLAVVAATLAGVVISWASNGALVSLFNALLRHARSLVGA